MPRKKTQWSGAAGERLALELVGLIPSFIAEIEPRRVRATGEIFVRCADIRVMAAKQGIFGIPNKRLSIAMIAAGGKHHAFGNGASSYLFEGHWQKPELIESAARSVAQYLNTQKEIA